MPEITIGAAAVDSPEWAELFVKSIQKFTTVPHEIIVVDNGSLDRNLSWLRSRRDIRLIENGENRGHGGAMDQITMRAQSPYVCILDIDAHVQRHDWERDLVGLYRSDSSVRLIGCRGPEHKPLHPPLFFFEREWILSHGISWAYKPEEPRSTDTAQLAYWKILDAGYKVLRLEKSAKVYTDCIGDEINIGERPAIFHGWYGTRFRENTDNPALELDGYKLEDHLKEKARVFSQPLVMEIMRET
jgi:glycosyltransferase involved in cell wall biosynthesis